MNPFSMSTDVHMHTPGQLRALDIARSLVALGGSVGFLLFTVQMMQLAHLPAPLGLPEAMSAMLVSLVLLMLMPDPAAAGPGHWASLRKLAMASPSDEALQTLARWARSGQQLTLADVRLFKRYLRYIAILIKIHEERIADEDAHFAAGSLGVNDPGTKFYVCSRTHHADLWKTARARGAPILSTWIDEAGAGETADLGLLWERIEREIRAATAVVVFARADDFPLKGALVEAGMAIAAGKPIRLVLAPDVELESPSCRPIGSWIRHPLVHRFDSIQEALVR